MKTFVALACAFLLVVSAAAQSGKDDAVKSELIKIEKQFWEGWKNNDTKVYEQNIAPGSLGVSVEGIMTKEEMLKMMKTAPPCTVNTYSFDEPSARLSSLGKDKYLLVYKATVDATCDGHKIPDTWFSTTIWQKQKGKWQALFHQETPLMGPPGQPKPQQ